MIEKHLIEEIINVSLSMFRKNFFGIYHGSISARIDANSFLINTKNAIFDEITEASLIELDSSKKDYRWNTASVDSIIHDEIYTQLPQAKYIAYTMPPHITAYALENSKFSPEDYFGNKFLGEIEIYDPSDFGDWYDRAPYEIANFFKNSSTHLMLIKGYGVYAYDRDLTEIAKRTAILENSARLLILGG